ncbi:MAG: sulfite exporter TauE/SafE family protein [bacterium]
MPEIVGYIISGFAAGLFGGYLGLGGGELLIPLLTVVYGLDIKSAVPISVTAVMVNSFSSSIEYLKKGMVDVEIVVILSIFTVMGAAFGSTINNILPDNVIRICFSILLVYAAFSFLKGRTPDNRPRINDNRKHDLRLVYLLSFLTGSVSALVGIGGGVLLLPLIYLMIRLPLNTARGSSTLIICFSSTAAAAIYFIQDRILLSVVSPVILGILIGGKIGGFLGTIAKPTIVRILFFLVMIYLAYRMISNFIGNIL